jgi:hypothetical protein
MFLELLSSVTSTAPTTLLKWVSLIGYLILFIGSLIVLTAIMDNYVDDLIAGIHDHATSSTHLDDASKNDVGDSSQSFCVI